MGLLCLRIDRKMDSVLGQEHQRTSSKYTNSEGQSATSHTDTHAKVETVGDGQTDKREREKERTD